MKQSLLIHPGVYLNRATNLERPTSNLERATSNLDINMRVGQSNIGPIIQRFVLCRAFR